MLRRLTHSSLVLVTLALSAGTAWGQTWNLDTSHTRASFSARHMMVTTVRGDFRNVTGTVVYAVPDVSKAAIDVSIDATTLSTQNDRRDEHLKSADFLDVEKFPRITFKSTRVEPVRDGVFRVVGNLTIRDVTREVALAVEVPPTPIEDRGQLVVGTTATTRINRKDFGMTWNRAIESGGWLVSDDITITLDVQMRRSAK